MLLAGSIAQLDQMLVARPAAIGLVRSRRQHGAENAMLHVEQRHVLMDDHFQPIGRNGRNQLDQLIAIQIIRRGDPPGAEPVQPLGRQLVGHVERKIGDAGHAELAGKSRSPPDCGPENRRPVPGHDAKHAGLVRLLNSRRGQQNRRPGRVRPLRRHRHTGECLENRPSCSARRRPAAASSCASERQSTCNCGSVVGLLRSLVSRGGRAQLARAPVPRPNAGPCGAAAGCPASAGPIVRPRRCRNLPSTLSGTIGWPTISAVNSRQLIIVPPKRLNCSRSTLDRQRMFLRFGQRLGRFELAGDAAGPSGQPERLADRGLRPRCAAATRRRGRSPANEARNCLVRPRLVGFPKLLADRQPAGHRSRRGRKPA